jgi:cobalt/nickel transport system permease protein
MTDLFVILRRCGVPVVLIELSMIIYRTIFILMDQVVQIQKAQVMRLGYSSLRESIHSCAMLCGAVFIGSWDAGEDLVRAMDARCYDGRFVILGETRPLHPGPVLAAGAFLVTSAIVVVFTAGITAI